MPKVLDTLQEFAEMVHSKGLVKHAWPTIGMYDFTPKEIQETKKLEGLDEWRKPKEDKDDKKKKKEDEHPPLVFPMPPTEPPTVAARNLSGYMDDEERALEADRLKKLAKEEVDARKAQAAKEDAERARKKQAQEQANLLKGDTLLQVSIHLLLTSRC